MTDKSFVWGNGGRNAAVMSEGCAVTLRGRCWDSDGKTIFLGANARQPPKAPPIVRRVRN